MTKEEFDQTDSDLSYEEYLENFEEEIADANDTIILYQYALDQNIPPRILPIPPVRICRYLFSDTVVTLGIIVIGSSIVSSEYNTGTIRLLLIRPKKRSKILLSKCISVLLIAAVLLALCFGCYLAATIFVYGSEDFAYPILSVANGIVSETPVLQTILPVFAKSAVVILFCSV
jgi:ABC-2 type transport system permease protein